MQVHVACVAEGDGPLVPHLQAHTLALRKGDVVGRGPRTLTLEACVSAHMRQIFLGPPPPPLNHAKILLTMRAT